jgi:Fe-S cluster biogenesis protein NfuA
VKKKLGDLTLREFESMCLKYKNNCNGCPIEHEMMACPVMSQRELDTEIDIPDEIYAVDLKEIEIQDGNK